MKNSLFHCLLVISLLLLAGAASVDTLIGEQKYAEALAQVRAEIKDSFRKKDEMRWAKLVVQEAQLQIGLHGYETAVRDLKKHQWPNSTLAQAMVQIVYAQSLRTYAQSYSWEIRNRERVESKKEVDLKAWTADQIYLEAYKTYAQLWEQREKLGGFNKDKLPGVIEANTYPAGIRGTLRDSVTYLLAQLLADTTGWTPRQSNELHLLDAQKLFTGMASANLTDAQTHPLQKISYVLNDLANWHQKSGRRDAALDARLELINILHDQFSDKTTKELAKKFLKMEMDKNSAVPWVTMAYAQYAEMHMQSEAWDGRMKAFEIAQKGAALFPSTLGAAKCRDHMKDLKRPHFSLESMNVDTAKKRSIVVQYQNVERLKFKSFAFDMKAYLKTNKDYSVRPQNWQTIEAVVRGTPSYEWQVDMPTTKDYRSHQYFVTPPSHKPGFYIVAAEDPITGQRTAAQIYFSDLVLVVHKSPQIEQRELRVHVYSGATGRPVRDAQVNVATAEYGKGNAAIGAGKTDREGVFKIPLKANQNSLFVTAEKGPEFVSSLNPFGVYGGSVEQPFREGGFLYADRSIYRPGQKIFWKTIAYEGDPRNSKYKLISKVDVTVALNDANGQVVLEKTVKTNAHGSAAGEFTIPAGKLLGNWSLTASRGGQVSFKVEEYKRPTFEVEISEDATPARLNHPVTVKALAKYYFGQPLTQGQAKWRVERRAILPWWCFWGRWSWGPVQAAQVIATGTAKIESDGSITVKFTPRGDERLAGNLTDIRYGFDVSIDVTDEGGETRSASQSLQVGFTAVMASISRDAQFFLANTSPQFTIKRTNLDGQALPGMGRWSVALLQQPSETVASSEMPLPAELLSLTKDEFRTPDDLKQTRWSNKFTAGSALREWKESKTIASGELAKNKDQPSLPKLAAGVYRLSYETKDAFGASYKTQEDFVVAGKDMTLQLPGFFAVEKTSVEVGDKIRIFAASGFKDQHMVVETYRRGRLLKRQTLSGGSHLWEVPVTEQDRGGISFGFYLVNDFQQVMIEQNVTVPWSNKELKLSYTTFRDKLRPGSKEKWTFKVLGPDGKPLKANTEVLAYMYDRSLDSFTAHTPANPFALLYFQHHRNLAPDIELGSAPSLYIQSGFNYPTHEYAQPRIDQVNFYPNYGIGGMGSRGGFGGRGGIRRKGGMEMEGFAMMSDVAAPMAANLAEKSMAKEAAMPAPVEAPKSEPKKDSQVRSEFAETAFWKPQLISDPKGEVHLEFTVPDSVTSWNVWAHAITDSLMAGMLKQETRTVKELMIRPYLPRFLREGDEAILKVAINNTSNKNLSGVVNLELTDLATKKPIHANFNLSSADLKRNFTVKANGSMTLSYKVKTPARPETVAIKVVASTDQLSDGEIRPLPILPGRFHLAQSKFVTLKDKDSRTLTFDDLAKDKDPTRINNQMVVTLDAQLFYSVLSSLPYLLEHPYKSVEQTLNRYVSAGILTSVFDKFPAVRSMAKTLAQRKTPLERWDEQDPNRKMALEETPWLQASRGGSQTADMVAVLDPTIAKAEMLDSLTLLQKSQDSSGGFPWFQGGRPSVLMTLYVIHGLSKAIEFGIQPPKPMAVKAWSYLRNYYAEEFPNVLKHEYCPEWVTFLNYTISQYPDSSWTGNIFSATEREQMLNFSFRHWKEHSPYLKSYLALTLHRANRLSQAKLVWDSVMDSAKTSQDEGTHWAAEDRSWLWYNDTIESHAMALRAGSEMGTSPKLLDGMVQWLFLNKKLNHWKSTRATAEVIYSLTHYLSKTQQLGVREEATVTMGAKSYPFTFDPAKYTGKKNQVIITADDVTEKLLPIKVEKSTKGHMFASATWHYSTEKLPSEARGDFFAVTRQYFKRVKDTDGAKLLPLSEGQQVQMGDEVEVQLSLTSKHAAEYVHLRDPRAAGFEPVDVVSTHKWDLGIGWFEEIRDSGTNFFFEGLPQGQYTFKYRIRAATSGTFKTSPATVQPLYAPEFVGFSAGNLLKVE